MPTYTAGKAVQNVSSGIYDCEIIKAEEKISEKGNTMIKLDVQIIRPDGTRGPTIWDYLVFVPKSFFKIDHVLWSIGTKPKEGETINVEAGDFIGQKAVVEVGETDGDNASVRFNKIERWIYGDEKADFKSGKTKERHIQSKSNGYSPDGISEF